jgi:hypothetical protein
MGISRRHHLQWMEQQVQWSERQRSDQMSTLKRKKKVKKTPKNTKFTVHSCFCHFSILLSSERWVPLLFLGPPPFH